MKPHKNTSTFQAASSFFETNRKIPAFFFQNCRKFLKFKTPTPPPPGKESWAKTRPPGSENVRILGGCPGVGWSGLELTDTLIQVRKASW